VKPKNSFKHGFAILSLAAVIPSFAWAESFRISDIRVEGLQRVSASPVFAALPLQVGDTADEDSISTAISSLFATGFFSDIQVLHEGGVLIVTVKERPAISEVKLDGNKAIKTEQLNKVLKDQGIAVGQIFQKDTLDALVHELERQYVAQGRYGAKVEAKVVEQPNNQIKLDIKIDESKVSGIINIQFVGNNTFDDGKLKDLFDLKAKGWFSFLSGNNHYAKEKLKGDIEKLESYYLDRGYLDFKVVSSQVSLSPDKKSVFITLNLHEGEIYKVNKVSIAGDPILPETAIEMVLLLAQGDIFSQNLMTTTSEYITTLLGNAGYTNAKVEGIPQRNEESKTVDIDFFINPGQRVYVRRINFKGNTRTTDEVLRREMRQMESASAIKAKIEQGKVRLERLGFFKTVEVENKEVPGSADLVDVEYKVEEQPSGSINGSIGYGQGSGAIFQAGLEEKNWLGTGKELGVAVSYNKYVTQYSLNYNDPYFTADGVSRGISLFYSKRDYGYSNVADYTTNNYGLSVNFGYPISEIQRLNFGLGFDHTEVKLQGYAAQEIIRSPVEIDLSKAPYTYINSSNLSKLSNNDPDGDGLYEDYSYVDGLVAPQNLHVSEPGFIDLYGDVYNSLNISASWLRSTLNRGILATRGNQESLTLKVGLPSTDLQYYKLEFNGQYFQPLTEDLTLRFKADLGYGDGYGDMDRYPFFNNFFAGGFGSVRGFRRYTLGPQSSPSLNYLRVPTSFVAVDNDFDAVNSSPFAAIGSSYILCDNELASTCGALGEKGKLEMQALETGSSRAYGGNVLIEFSTELLFPLPFIEDQRSFQTALFVDAGNVFDTHCGDLQDNCSNVDLSKLSSSYGLGLSWLSGFGPLTFSISRPIHKNETDRTEVFQFSLGAGF
jgi:outer membrane protein insertion porin family